MTLKRNSVKDKGLLMAEQDLMGARLPRPDGAGSREPNS